jgi:hypothetical protein
MLEREISMPWSGLDSECCENLKRNNGLYTQCMNKKEKGGDCKGCVKCIEKNGGVSKHGRVSDRLKVGIMDYIDPCSGKKVSRYSEYMKKNNVTREEVLRYGKMMGVEIGEIHFEEGEDKKKRGRPKKVTEEKVEEKKKRGRPKKEKQVVTNGAGEDLIASLLEESREEKKESVLEKKMEIDMEKKMESVEEEKKESVLENEKESDMENEKESVEEEKMEIDMEEKNESVLEEKNESVLEEKKESVLEEKKESVLEEDTSSEDEEETVVIKFDIKGVTYLKSSDNVLYDMSSHDVVGIWNEERSEIEEVSEESEDEEE